MKHIFILNPVAGKHRAEVEILPIIRAAAKDTGIDYEIHRTLNVGEATTFVQSVIEKANGEALRFYAIGGDGTISEVANGMIGAPNVELAVLPSGSGNDFCKMIGPSSILLDLFAQITGNAEPVDVIRVNDRYCVNMINIGIDGSTAAQQAVIKEKTPFGGLPSYLIALAGELKKNTGVHLEVKLDDGRTISKLFTLCAVANGSFCGGGFRSAPKAHINDGLLDVGLVDRVDRRTFLKFAMPYRKGTHLENKGIQEKHLVEYVQCRSLAIQNPDNMPVCIDGEIVYEKELRVESVPKALQVVVPAGCSI